MQQTQFISERIAPEAGAFDPGAMSRGEPALPRTFRWRGQRFEVARVVQSARRMGQDRGDSYVRRHYHDIETTDAVRMSLYFDRNPRDRNARKQWWLYTLTLPDPVIATERLQLRRWTLADRDAFFRMVQDPELMLHLHDFVPMSDAQAQDALEETVRRYSVGYGDWAIVDRQNGDILGESGLTPMPPDVEMTWMLLPRFQGHGYAFEAAHAVQRYAFETLQLAKLVAHVRPANARSARVAAKLGMRRVRAFTNADGQEMVEYECVNDAH
ncbi:MAG: GNAT family N-acetyltransferase [Candidatus Eremiobacteraeota bacterium]|nr:GNAT family N-acetyltransferase [Candidatus Eremiobacteraeota bacterium]MBV8596291.1 GNAT family N-acetyltransferase [Candidatus Eremiobacteraeota bacterium]